MPRSDDDLIGSIYDAVAAPDAWLNALERLQARFEAEAAILGIYDPKTRNISISFTSGAWTKDVMESYARDYVKVDPAVPKFARQPAGSAVSTETILSPAEKNGTFFNEFMRPLGLSECLGGRLLDIPGGFSAVAVHRGRGRPPFDAAEKAALERVIPHVARAFQLHRAFALLETKASLLISMVDRLIVGIVATDHAGRPVHVNASALRLIGRKDGLQHDRDGKLRANDRASDRRLLALQHDVIDGGAGGTVRVPREQAQFGYSVLVAPLPASFGLSGSPGKGRSGILALLHDPDFDTPAPAQTLAAMFGLTQRRAELAAALAAGDDLHDYAKRTGISINTVRFHLKGLFATLGVRSQAQLVRLMVRALAEFSLAGIRPHK